ncbi:MAG: hypothetical protein ACRERU_11345 [Methylococcales bacterium]
MQPDLIDQAAELLGTSRSDRGRRCRDTFASLKKTCRKYRVMFREYLNAVKLSSAILPSGFWVDTIFGSGRLPIGSFEFQSSRVKFNQFQHRIVRHPLDQPGEEPGFQGMEDISKVGEITGLFIVW